MDQVSGLAPINYSQRALKNLMVKENREDPSTSDLQEACLGTVLTRTIYTDVLW